jgi:hypothetical protein
MVVWFELTQFGYDGKEVPVLPINEPSFCSHPAHSKINTLSYPKNFKYTDLAIINS